MSLERNKLLLPEFKEDKLALCISLAKQEQKKPVERQHSFFYAVKMQLTYFSPFVWTLASILAVLALFLCGMFVKSNNNENLSFLLCTIGPALISLFAPQILKSDYYGMSELESVGAYSLSQLVTARLTVIGVFNAMMIASICALSNVQLGIIQSLLYLVVPFEFSCAITFFVLSLQRNRMNQILCLVSPIVIGLLSATLVGDKQIVLMINTDIIWGGLLLFFTIGTVVIAIQFVSHLKPERMKLDYGSFNT
ncbi:MAG: hypothetical protein RR313_08265 [Anaerovoracaceae bacterium]